jgi:hypothetical protein
MSNHSKCSVVVISSSGQAHTTKRGARRLIDRKLAARQPDGTLRMFEGDYRFECAAASTAGPTLRMKSGRRHKRAEVTECGDCHRRWFPDGKWLTCEALAA